MEMLVFQFSPATLKVTLQGLPRTNQTSLRTDHLNRSDVTLAQHVLRYQKTYFGPRLTDDWDKRNISCSSSAVFYCPI